MKKLGVGIVGIGKISEIYLQNLSDMFNNVLSIVAISDLVEERTAQAAMKYDIAMVMSFEEMLNCKDIDLILNLTTPQHHFDLNRKSLEAGKHIYVEKPLSLSSENASFLVSMAKEKGLLLGGAPDTFLGSGIQTCKKLIEDGWIGKPIAASAFMMNHGHESWHPDPEFYYKNGGGPLFDMGPYYITALVSMLGPIDLVSGVAQKTFAERTITSEPKKGTVINVDVETHIASLLHFKEGAVGTLVTSFDVHHHTMPHIEVYGTEGTLRVPDPNTFGGPILCCRQGSKEWKELPLLFPYAENSRGLGVADMATALQTGADSRVSGLLTRHVVEVMEAILTSSNNESQIRIEHPFIS